MGEAGSQRQVGLLILSFHSTVEDSLNLNSSDLTK